MIIQGDCSEILSTLEAGSVQCCVTSPPYWGLRDYGCAGQLGLEQTPEEYVGKLVRIFREVRRVLKGDGTVWLNLGDSYAGGTRGSGGTDPSKRTITGGHRTNEEGQHFANHSRRKGSGRADGIVTEGSPRNRDGTSVNGSSLPIKSKDLVGIPWRTAFALQADGWYLRQDIIWHKPNPMPESVTDRCTKSHEYIFLLTKSQRYFYDADAVQEPSGCNRRSVWTITPKPFGEAHFATFPPEIPEICIRAGSRPGDIILDPFAGAGTTGLVAAILGRKFVGIELNQAYVKMAQKRINLGTAQGRLFY